AGRLGSTVRFLHVVDLTYVVRAGEGTSVYATQLADVTRAEGAKLLDPALQHAADAGVSAEAASVEIMTGRPADEIVAEAQRCGADLIVMGTHGRRGLQRAMLGSDAERVLRHASVPVLLVPSRKRSP
ncbi:MAG TPA: universal stress protein, partial [Burkholderiaceae bacterium]|nr:universal stress protein [Burkholderiaceae bacterium]